MKQISIQVSDETARQIAGLAHLWGLPAERHNTPVIERCIERVWQEYNKPAARETPAETQSAK